MALLQGYQQALKRLGRREHSSIEMQRFLQSRGVGADECQEVLSQLMSQDLINDGRLTKTLACHHAARGKGALYIRAKLLQKGLTLELPEIRALIQESQGTDESELARDWATRRYPKIESDSRQRSRAFQALLRRGYSHEVARIATQTKV